MIITECYIENFGKISAKKFEFNKGFNKILADNGEGKTTLSVFIKCMLYGMSDTKKSSLDENERKRYLPWSGALAGGSLTFTVGDKSYRAERSFAQKPADDTFKLYDTKLGRESFDYTENLGEELFALDAESFERTVFLSERNLSPKNSNKSISAKLSELVGCDGDISSMDDALKLLEEQRKAYSKKGGSGEIADIRAEISRLSAELDMIGIAEGRMKTTEQRLSELVVRESKLREEEQGIIRERETLAKQAGNLTYRNTVSEMKARLSASEARRDALITFFKGQIPSSAAIDRAKITESEINQLKADTSNKESPELTELKAYFDGKADPEQIEDIKTVFDRFRLGAYEESENAKKRRRIFAKRTPEKSELEKEIADIKAAIKKPVLPTVFTVIGALLAIAGIALGAFVSPWLAPTVFIGIAVIIAVPIFYNTTKKNEIKALRKKLAAISDEAAADTRDPLIIFSEMLELLNTADERPPLEEEDEKKLLAFTAVFSKSGNIFADVSDILKKYESYKSVSAIEKYKSDERARKTAELSAKELELSVFLDGFSHITSDPIEEARSALAEYTRLSGEIIEKRKDIEALTSNHETREDSFTPSHTSDELAKRGGELSDIFSEISRERALLDRQYRADSELIDSREEIRSKKEELEEKLSRYSENLDIIKMTKKYLEAARESMTTRYLGKTRTAFEEYIDRIGGEKGSFEMDTNFGISKLEGAKTHPTEAYSRGIRDLYSLASKFALIDSLYENEEPFVILDDPFIALDDKKCDAALALLEEFSRERQIIYFTCSKSRA